MSPWAHAVRVDALNTGSPQYTVMSSVDISYVYWRDTASAQNYHVALRSMRTECQIYKKKIKSIA